MEKLVTATVDPVSTRESTKALAAVFKFAIPVPPIEPDESRTRPKSSPHWPVRVGFPRDWLYGLTVNGDVGVLAAAGVAVATIPAVTIPAVARPATTAVEVSPPMSFLNLDPPL